MQKRAQNERNAKSAYGRVNVTRRGHVVTLQNNRLQASYDLNTGRWSYGNASGQWVARGARLGWTEQNGTERWTTDDGERRFMARPASSDEYGDGAVVHCSFAAGGSDLVFETQVELYSGSPWAVARARIRNEGSKPRRIDRIVLAETGGESGDGVFLGSDPTDCCLFLNGSKQLARGAYPIRKDYVYPDQLTDESVSDGMIYDPHTQKTLAFGFLTQGRWWNRAEAGYRPALMDEAAEEHPINVWRVYQSCEEAEAPPGGVIESDPFYIDVSTPFKDAQTRLIRTEAPEVPPSRLRSSLTARLEASSDKPLGQEMRKLVERLSNGGGSLPICPGGLQQLRIGGEWGALNEETRRFHFPDGIADAVAHAQSAGLSVGAETPIYRLENPPKELEDAVVRARNGRPAVFGNGEGSKAKTLDPTREETRNWVLERLDAAYNEWGLDALYVSIHPLQDLIPNDMKRHRWSRRGLTRMEAMCAAYDLLESARQKVAPDKILSVRDAPQGPRFAQSELSNGGLDYFYKSLSPVWDGQWGSRELLRAFMSKWNMRSDGSNLELGPLRFVEERARNEAQLFIAVGLLSGAHLCLADDLPKLNSDEASFLRKCLPLTGISATTVPIAGKDLLAWSMPLQAAFGDWTIVGVVNLSDIYHDAHIRMEDLGLSRTKPYLAYEFWDGVYFGEHQAAFSAHGVPPRSAKLFVIREEQETPMFLASDLHVLQGKEELLTIGWDESSESILGVCQGQGRGRGALYFYVPPAYIPTGVSCVGAKYSYRWKAPVFKMTVSLKGEPAPFHIRFARTEG